MGYTLDRISLRSALKVGLLLGWLVAVLPSLLAAGLAVVAVQQLNMAFGQMAPYELSLLGQTVASIDPLAWLGLADTAASIGGLADQGATLFLTLAAGFTLAGGLGVALTATLFCLLYNLLAAIGGGVRIELQPTALRARREG